MNKRNVLASLNKIANVLDNSGLYKEANIVSEVMQRLAEDKVKTEYSDEELKKALTEEGIQSAHEGYKKNGGKNEIKYFKPEWTSLVERMLAGFSSEYGAEVASEKYKRKNPYWSPRD
jgi:hypothetical protein